MLTYFYSYIKDCRASSLDIAIQKTLVKVINTSSLSDRSREIHFKSTVQTELEIVDVQSSLGLKSDHFPVQVDRPQSPFPVFLDVLLIVLLIMFFVLSRIIFIVQHRDHVMPLCVSTYKVCLYKICVTQAFININACLIVKNGNQENSDNCTFFVYLYYKP